MARHIFLGKAQQEQSHSNPDVTTSSKALKISNDEYLGIEILKGRPHLFSFANKANDAVIRLDEEADSAAVQRTVDSSSRD